MEPRLPPLRLGGRGPEARREVGLQPVDELPSIQGQLQVGSSEEGNLGGFLEGSWRDLGGILRVSWGALGGIYTRRLKDQMALERAYGPYTILVF